MYLVRYIKYVSNHRYIKYVSNHRYIKYVSSHINKIRI